MVLEDKRTVTAYLGLGSNLGDRRDTLVGARAALDGIPGIRVTASSPLYETEPVGGPQGQGPYLNAVLRVETGLAPLPLLRRCLEVEARFGRERHVRWGARTLDIDLLLYDEVACSGPELELPHPRLHLRRFVLAPLRDVAAGLIHPLLQEPVSALLAALPPEDGVRRVAETW